MDICQKIQELVFYARVHLGLSDSDRIYFANKIYHRLGINSPVECNIDEARIKKLAVPDTLILPIVEYALQKGITNKDEAANFGDEIMGLVTPLQSRVEQEFEQIERQSGIQDACSYLYNLGVKSHYIKKTAIDKNIIWRFDGEGGLVVTINLTKPEKDNAEIARLRAMPSFDYPKCVLCYENLGWWGTCALTARQNLRFLPTKLSGEDWFVQFSPYAYFNEHVIVINKKHTPMTVEERTLGLLADFVDRFDHYFVGSNASLPIIGGSLLSHEHFQGGRELMPLHFAKARHTYADKELDEVEISVPDWFNSVVRMQSKNRTALTKCAAKVINSWRDYSDESVQILAKTDAQHNSVAPIMRKSEGKYILDMILRNNRTNSDYPDGIFHAHPQYHKIKKEGIGLIEAMGLFILPPRLLGEIEKMKQEQNKTEEQIKQYIHGVCQSILVNTAVFKPDQEGENAFARFLSFVGFEQKN